MAKTTQYLAVLLAGTMILPAGLVSAAGEDEGNWRLGRIYYRTVCTACHKEMTGEGVSPASKTIAEWQAYFDADKHDLSGKTKPAVSYYASQEYRETIRGKNKVANKLIDVSDEELMADVRAFLVHGASDSDNPTRCR